MSDTGSAVGEVRAPTAAATATAPIASAGVLGPTAVGEVAEAGTASGRAIGGNG